MTAKKETNQLIGDYYRPGDTITIRTDSATRLSSFLEPESVDYVFTDPPYGAHIAYLDLLSMWHSWLGLKVTDEDRALEVIEAGDLNKSKHEYMALLEKAIEEIFKVLKWDRWFSIVFSHKDPAYWDAVVSSAERAGFEYVNTVIQPVSVVWSMYKKRFPLSVLSGELVINFRKIRNPKTIAIVNLGSDVVDMIKNAAEVTIVRNNGATIEEIYNDLIPILLENGLLAAVKSKISDVTPILQEEFAFGADGRWRIRPNTKLGTFVPLQDRIRFYVIDYLTKPERRKGGATFDEVVYNVMPNLVNGRQPTNQSILEVLEQVAYSPDGVHWVLGAHAGSGKQLDFSLEEAMAAVPALPVGPDIPHNEVIYRLAKLALAAGLLVHVGKKEQSSTWNNERLANLSIRELPFERSLSSWSKAKVEQIDCIWLSTDGTPIAAFEVEATTPITTGIDRFLELLQVSPEVAGRLVIVAPGGRQRELNAILRSSHYVGHPMYMENKLVYVFYDDLLHLYGAFIGLRPSQSTLLARLDKTVNRPRLKP